jgi:hypothetical protein
VSDRKAAEKAGEGTRKAEAPVFESYSRSRREGAFVSPFGTEGAQWEGFPEYDEEGPDGPLGPTAGEKP